MISHVYLWFRGMIVTCGLKWARIIRMYEVDIKINTYNCLASPRLQLTNLAVRLPSDR